LGAHEDVDAVDLKQAEATDGVAQLCRTNLVMPTPGVKTLRCERDVASLRR
jgi:hypothetical protein